MSSKSNAYIRTEKYPLPDSVDGILSLLREILDAGGVQRVEIAMDLPLKVSRLIPDADPELQEPIVNLDGVLRNIEMVEYFSEGASSYQVIVDMMQLVRKENLNCVCWVAGVGEDNLLNQWLEFENRGMPSGVEFLLDRPVYRLRSLPEDTLILCGSKYPSAEFDELSLAVKTAIEVRRSSDDQRIPRSEIDDPIWPNPSERRPTAGQLAFASGELRRVDWKRPSQLGE